MPDFPFEKVYDFIANPLVGAQLPAKDLNPAVMTLCVENGEIVQVAKMLPEKVVLYFTNRKTG